MSDPVTMKIAAHRNNIGRYRRVLRTQLTPLERQWLQRRLAEEQAELKMLGFADVPSAKPRFRTSSPTLEPTIPAHIIAATNRLHDSSSGGPFHSG